MNAYTHYSILNTLGRIGKPCGLLRLWTEWCDQDHIEEVKKVEGIQNGTPSLDVDAVQMVFNAAVLELLDTGEIYKDEDKRACLKEWKIDPHKMRSVDDDWEA